MVSVEDHIYEALVADSKRANTRIKELEAKLGAANAYLTRLDDELIGKYGEIDTMPEDGVRQTLGNVARIMKMWLA